MSAGRSAYGRLALTSCTHRPTVRHLRSSARAWSSASRLNSSMPAVTVDASWSSCETRNGGPGLAGRLGTLARDRRLDQPVGPVSGDEDLAVVLQVERREIDQEVVLVGRGEPDLGHLGMGLEHVLAHDVEGLLECAAIGPRERREHDVADGVV